MKQIYKTTPEEAIDTILKYIRSKKDIKLQYMQDGVAVSVIPQELTEFEKASLSCALMLEEKINEGEINENNNNV